MPTASTVPIDSHAIATLRYIRSSIEAATSIAVPGSSGIAMGCVGMIAAVLSSTYLREYWMTVWVVAAVVAGIAGSVLLSNTTSLRGLTFSSAPARKLALCLLPSLFAGAALTAAFQLSANLRFVPGTWLLLYGCALIAASLVTRTMVAVMGGLFMALGLLALLVPSTFHMALLGTGFGGLHLLFGILIGRNSRTAQP
jgi:hypothetical protein